MSHMSEEEFALRFPNHASKVIAKARSVAGDGLASEQRRMERDKLESTFLFAWRRLAGAPEPVRQHKFAPERKYAFDFCWPDVRLAVEIHGGQFVNGGHNRGKGQTRDMEKKRLAIELGWRVLEYGTEDMANPLKVAEEVLRILKKGST